MGVRALYVGVIAFASGVALASGTPVGLPFIACLGVIAGGLAALTVHYRSDQLVLLGAVMVAATALGMLRMEWAWSQVGVSPLLAEVGNTVTISGVVAREPDLRERSTHIYVRSGADTVLVIADRYSAFAYGDVVSVTGELAVPESFTNDLGRTFNYPGYLLARGVERQMFYPTVEVQGSGQGNVILTGLLTVKERFTATVATVLPEPQFGLSVGLLLGVKQALGESLETIFRIAGITHIVVLSGYNVMLVVVFVNFVLARLFSLHWRLVFGLIAIAGFALMVGLSATVVRASIMAAFGLIAYTFGRAYLVLRGLLVAGCIMLVINPFLLAFDVGFQLSFMATLGLLLVAPQLESYVPQVAATLRWREFFLATLATQIAVLPLLLYHMGEVSLIAVVVNVLVLPMVPVAMLLTFVTGIVALVAPVAATLLAYPTYASLTYIIAIATWWAQVPYAAVGVPVFPLWALPVSYALMGALLYWQYARSRQVSITTSAELNGWTIEDEEQVLAHEKGASLRDAPSTTLPVFFRK